MGWLRGQRLLSRVHGRGRQTGEAGTPGDVWGVERKLAPNLSRHGFGRVRRLFSDCQDAAGISGLQ